MKLSANETNILKANIEGCEDLISLYNRLKWDECKTLRLSVNEKDIVEGILIESGEEKELQIIKKIKR